MSALLVTTVLMALGLTAITTLTAVPAGADPQYKTAFVGGGSDTIQDLFNAFQGAAPFPPGASQPAKYYTPLHSSDATADLGIVSWDAVDPSTGAAGCLAPGAKLGGAELDRPNGSGAGMSALSAANDGSAWAPTTNCGETPTSTNDATGQFDYSRSSSGPNPAKFPGTQLTFLPFARDGVTYMYFSPGQADHGTADAANLTSTTLQQLFGTGNASTSGKVTLGNGHVLFACMMQSGSGTGKFWDQAMGNDGTGTTADASAVASGCSDTLEENGGNTFEANAFVQGLGNDVAIIPFSAGSYVAQLNKAALDRTSTGVAAGAALGSPDALGAPFTGTAPNLVPSPTYYASTIYGRDLYVVLPTNKATGVGNAAIKSIFVGTTSAICSSSMNATVGAFGFTRNLPSPQTCGMTGLTQGFTQ